MIKHKLLDLKTQKDPNKAVVGDFNTTLSPTDGSFRQKKSTKKKKKKKKNHSVYYSKSNFTWQGP
jgi:hypothetical protein